jgi:PhnB protein
MSAIQTSPYINFQGHAREAMEFYQQALGGTLSLYTVDAQGVARPADSGDSISYARLDADGLLIIGSDGHPSYPPTVGDNVAIAVSGTDKDRLSAIFSGLAEGGNVKMPLSPQPWGGETGWLSDKFGMNWMVNVDKA